MAINFKKLATTGATNAIFPEGKYYSTITKAELKTSKSGNEYLNLMYEVYNKDQKKLGVVWDKIMDSDKALLQFKLRRFIMGFEIPIGEDDEFELSDLVKIVTGRSAIVDYKLTKDEQFGDRMEPNIFTDHIFTSLKEASNEDTFEKAEDDIPFTAPSTETSNEESF